MRRYAGWHAPIFARRQMADALALILPIGLAAAVAQPVVSLRRSPGLALAPSATDALQQRDQELEAAARRAASKLSKREAKLKREIEAIGERPAQAQSGTDRHRRARARRRGAHRRDGNAAQAARRQRARASAHRSKSRRAVIAEVLAALAAHRPPAAAGAHGPARRRAAVGAHRHHARRGAAGDARSRPKRWPPTSPSWCACARRSPTSASWLARDLAALAEERQRLAAADRGAAEEAGGDREGARRPSASGPPRSRARPTISRI